MESAHSQSSVSNDIPTQALQPVQTIHSSSKLPWILVVVLLLILVGGGGYFFGKTFGVSKLDMVLPTPTPPIDMTNDTIEPTTTSMSSLKTQTVKKLDNTAFSGFTITFPDEFAPFEVRTATSLDFNLQRIDQGIEIRQAPMGGGVCLFKDSPDFQGPSEDLKSVTYTQISTQLGEARYYNTTDNNYKTCWLSQGYYQSMSPVGVVTFSSSLNGYPGGLKSIEDVLKSIKTQ